MRETRPISVVVTCACLSFSFLNQSTAVNFAAVAISFLFFRESQRKVKITEFAMGTKRSGNAAPEQSPPKPQNKFTKWITRIVALSLLAATFTWLDGIKVSHSSNSSTAPNNLNHRTGGMF